MYMAVTTDEFELPIAVGDTAIELAKIIGTTANNIATNVSHGCNGIHKGYKFVRVEDIREEDE